MNKDLYKLGSIKMKIIIKLKRELANFSRKD
jgi:hypothetical protein